MFHMGKRILTILLLTILVFDGIFFSVMVQVQSYPLMALIPEQSKRCFTFTIPMEEDAHFIFLALPGPEELDDILITGTSTTLNNLAIHQFYEWFHSQVYQLTKQKTPQKIPDVMLEDPLPEINDKMERYLKQLAQENMSPSMPKAGGGDNKTRLRVTISKDGIQKQSSFPSKYFIPSTVNRIRQNLFPFYHRMKKAKQQQQQAAEAQMKNILDDTNRKRKVEEEEQPAKEDEVDAYDICFDNLQNQEKQMQVIFDILMVNIDVDEDEKTGYQKEKHISPVEEALDKGIDAVQSLINEMKHIEEREIRMRQTSDSINERVKYFSYFSVTILITISVLQILYLKRFFQKIKLL